MTSLSCLSFAAQPVQMVLTSCLFFVTVKETAHLLLDGMPPKGLRVLNIGFGIGMVCVAPNFCFNP
jgi:hypothetical protein